MAPFAAAIREAMSSGNPTTFHHVSDLGNAPVPIGTDKYLSLPDSPIDALALARCRGRVLDIGAGCGRHTLELQRLDIDVVALERSAAFIDILNEREVLNSVQADIYDYSGEDFDTLLLLDNTIGLAESPEGLVTLLKHLHTLARHGAELLIEGMGAYERAFYPELPFADERIEDFIAENEPYFPISTSHLEYENQIGESFSWIYPGESLLAACAQRAGWSFECLTETGPIDFLASLRRE